MESSLIPRKLLFGNPERTAVRLSPDGSRLSYLAPKDGVLNVWIAPVDDLEVAEPVTSDTLRGIRSYFWAYTNRHLFYLQDEGGNENWRLYRVDLGSLEARDLTPFEGVQARLEALSPQHPKEIVVGLNDRVPEYHDLYRVNIVTGALERILKNDAFESFVLDDAYRVRFGRFPTPDGGYLFKKREGHVWAEEPFVQVKLEDELTTYEVGLDAAGETLYMFDSRDRNTAALVALDAVSGEQTLLYSDPRADVANVLRHPSSGRVEAVSSTYERTTWAVLGPSLQKDFDYLRGVSEGDFQVVSRTQDDRRWVIAYTLDDGPVRYYLYTREEGEARFLFTDRPGLEGQPLAPMHPVVIPARDGLELVSYLTLPAWADGGNARPKEPLPTVLLVHGGPWGRDTWGFDSSHQWLANRGYAVLSVNFRASTGFGKAFVNAGNLGWGAAMHDDLLDAVDWAVAEGIADPARVAIMGGSYGGYATLVGLTFTPEVFAAGVDLVGPSNLQTLLETIPPYWQPQIELFAKRMGDHRTEEGRALLRERSPLHKVEDIRRPLLIGQGANDPRVKRSESDQIVGAMQARGVPVTYLLYPDEGHGFARPENTLSFFAVAEAFLAAHLGGRAEPIGEGFRGSSLEVKAGAAGIPELQEALARREP